MDIDWIIGVFVFIVFIGWSFSYYFAIFQDNGTGFGIAAEIGQEKIMGFAAVDVYEAPVKYYSGGAIAGGVLKAKSLWYAGEKNSTIVLSGGAPLPCIIDGNDLYWQADVAGGMNYYAIMFADANTTQNCTGTFSITEANLTSPWALEKKQMLSLAKINEMTNMSYDAFRSSIGMKQNFLILIETAGGETRYGKSVPSGPVNVNSKRTERMIFETMENANVTIAVW
jgi:hypothetical protein